MPPGIAVCKRGEQQGSGVRGHVQAVGDKGKGAKEIPADNLGHHHQAAQPDNGPGSAGVSVMPAAEEHVGMPVWNRRPFAAAHANLVT
jgi:hypothetical protein